jgi:chitodextrinase
MNLLVAGTHQLAIDWTPSTDNVGVTAYEVYRGGALVATVTTTWFLDSGLVASTNYGYQVRAVDAAGNRSTASTSLTARTASSTGSARGILAGYVVDSNGAAVRTATATFVSGGGQTKSDGANNKGVWSISNLLPVSGTLTISAPGHATVTLNVTVVAGKTLLTPTTMG